MLKGTLKGMAGAEGYITLDRRFADYRAGEESEPENWGFFYSSHLYAPHTWAKLLKHRCTVGASRYAWSGDRDPPWGTFAAPESEVTVRH